MIEKKAVLRAIDSVRPTKTRFRFSYFGALQAFRNEKKVFDIFESLHLKLDVFCYDEFESHPAVIKHEAKKGEDFYRCLAASDFLVVFDNSYPFNHYLPSKVFPYVSFTKPIIAFGDNKESAVKHFFNNYPLFYYHDFNSTTEELDAFICRFKNAEYAFDDTIYNSFSEYLPQKSLCEINDTISKIKIFACAQRLKTQEII